MMEILMWSALMAGIWIGIILILLGYYILGRLRNEEDKKEEDDNIQGDTEVQEPERL